MERKANYTTKSVPVKPDSEKVSKIKSAILRRLKLAQGLDNAISQEELFSSVKFSSGGILGSTRQLRDTINEMRNEGYLICSLSGTLGRQSGYYLPATLEEYRQYRAFHMSYAKNIFDTIRAMDASARKEFSFDCGLQPYLFKDLPEEKEFI